jgi:ribosome-associated translation inhibitor RaiA
MNCQISGLTENEQEYKEEIQKAIMSKCERIGVLADIIELKAHFKKHHDTGTKAKHSVKLHLFSNMGDFVAEHTDWEIMNALHESLRTLETEIKRKKSKLAD